MMMKMKTPLRITFLMIMMIQSNLDYPDSLGPRKIVQIIEALDNRK